MHAVYTSDNMDFYLTMKIYIFCDKYAYSLIEYDLFFCSFDSNKLNIIIRYLVEFILKFLIGFISMVPMLIFNYL